MQPRPDAYPRWASMDIVDPVSLSPNVIEPPEEKKDRGWNRLEKPPRQWENWLDRLTYQWIRYFDESFTNRLPASGTYTPIIAGSVTPGTGVYTAQQGFYQVIGDSIYVTVYVDQSSHTGTGDLLISLPLAADATLTSYRGTGSHENDNTGVMTILLSGVYAGTAVANFRESGGAGNYQIDAGDCYYTFSLFYKYYQG